MVIMLVLWMFFILQAIAYFTLLERHTLGLTQLRYGPNKVSFIGIIQPILDGIKLIKKEQIIMKNVSPMIFLGVTMGNFTLFYLEFLTLPYPLVFISFYWSYLLVSILVGVNVVLIVVGGIFSKSKYAYLGSIRSASASVAYEFIFTLNLILFMLYSKSYTMLPLKNLGLMLFVITFMISVLVELGRTPFDYVESESELVSGFNTEYSSVGFVLLFLKEYGSLLFFSSMISTIFFGGYLLLTFFFSFLFILIRSSFPRLRFDHLMGLMWTQLFFHIAIAVLSTYYIYIM